MTSSKATVTKVYQSNNEHQSPIILNFQNGKLKSDIPRANNFTCVHDKKSKQNIAILAINETIYHGKIYTDSQIDTYMAIRNKQTNKVRFIQMDQALLTNSIHEKKNTEIIKMDKQLAKTKLLKDFGGRGAGAYLNRVARMKMNIDSIEHQLNQTISNYENIDDTVTSENIYTDIFPPFNENAVVLSEMYAINEIISSDLLDRLDEEIDAILDMSGNLPIETEYILNEIKSIQTSEDKNLEKNRLKMKTLLYMDALVNLIKTRKRDLTKLSLSNITEKIENDIRKEFSARNSMKPMKTAYTTDKALYYFIVLVLLINPDHQIDINILTEILSMQRKKILQYASFVNAQLKGSNILKLYLPNKVKPAQTQPRKRKTM